MVKIISLELVFDAVSVGVFFCVDREIIDKVIGDFSFKNVEICENSRESISVVKFKNFNIISRGINN